MNTYRTKLQKAIYLELAQTFLTLPDTYNTDHLKDSKRASPATSNSAEWRERLTEACISHQRFFKRFERLDLEGSVYLHFSLLLRAVTVRSRRFMTQRSYRKIIATCFYISI